MSFLEIWFTGFFIFAIGVLFWQAGKPWYDKNLYWTHECERQTIDKNWPGYKVKIDLAEGQDCPWCGLTESENKKRS